MYVCHRFLQSCIYLDLIRPSFSQWKINENTKLPQSHKARCSLAHVFHADDWIWTWVRQIQRSHFTICAISPDIWTSIFEPRIWKLQSSLQICVFHMLVYTNWRLTIYAMLYLIWKFAFKMTHNFVFYRQHVLWWIEWLIPLKTVFWLPWYA